MLKNHSFSIHNLEVQIGQNANIIFERYTGIHPNNTLINLKVNAMSLSSKREIEWQSKETMGETHKQTPRSEPAKPS